MAVLFDTLKLADRLEAAGLLPEQARGVAAALAETITGDLATREYLDLRLGEVEARLRGEIHEAEARLRGEIAAARTEIAAVRGETHEAEARLRGEIQARDAALRNDIANLRTETASFRTEIANSRAELIRWAVGVGIAAVLAIGGMILSATLALLHAH